MRVVDGEQQHFASGRQRFFLLAAGLVLLLGGAYALFTPAVYQSNATVLMSAPTAIDEQLLAADIQGVAIQRRTLLGSELTRRLAEQVAGNYGLEIEPLDLRDLLDVRAISETNLLTLSAIGSQQQLLPQLVEEWITVYSAMRAGDIETRKAQTLSRVEEELEGLSTRIAAARSALEDFRREHEIISMERQENAVLSRLDGLNKALNNAVEEEVKASAYLNTLQNSLARGEQVVPQSQRNAVNAMSQELSSLRSRLDELRARYTTDYIQKDPRLREIPGQIATLEGALGRAYSEGTSVELANAQRAHLAAGATATEIEERLESQKAEVAAFNSIYATHQALAEDLGRLEELYRETQARLVQVEVRRVDKYPQVTVIDWPDPRARRIGPNYLLILGGTIGAALALGIFAVWLRGYLNPRVPDNTLITLSGVHMYPADAQGALEQAAQHQRIDGGDIRRLSRDQSADKHSNDDLRSPPSQAGR
ncbi:MAG: succinoglycan biosynthesis transport protein ExoP [Halieaceae bacterium]|jgi:succinoglycan biosynthesis transport protein ExoP